ncbi:diphthine--ammonia ligase [Chitinophagaceae bacterium LB-8]|uniref:Diphthine--ammonia ligase n=1 Tax=Paraflavisolibacter caeni TaxID=2982496 RepID=A0A9X2XYW2_9BACT|nr:diphthine--ammonia ligase [Paraflavisolibacter caeni]MCU7551730.1 diphthine--ammonia ligase [Paraflavisolibacter caeni]
MAHKSYFNWSGGKDSSLALYHALKDNNYSIERLLTNINNQYGRVSMHGVQEALMEQQAEAIGLPLQKLVLPDQPSMSEYEAYMMQTLQGLKEEQFTHAFFGDIFLEDLKVYRETQLARIGVNAVFPLWKRDTTELLHEFIDLGFKTILVCIKAELLDQSFAGRIIDRDFIKDLPKGVDPCGENGEFHTFVFDGPIFQKPVLFEKGEVVFREYKAPKEDSDNCFSGQPPRPASMGFWFCDLLPVTQKEFIS